MPYNGLGVFQRVYQWVADAANGIFVDATRTDTDSNDIAAGLTNCVTRDGQSPWTANLPSGGFKITGLPVGSNVGDSVNYGQVFNSPAFVTPSATTSPPNGDNSLLLATTAFAQQLAFQTALPAQSLGFLISSGTVASFSKKHVGYAQDEVRGADIPSAATINLEAATGNLVHITGTTAITAVTLDSGASREVVFDGILTLTNGASLILPTGANIVTAAGDCATFRGEPSGVVRVVKYQLANGRALAVAPLGDHEVVVHTGNGRGSTNTAIRRFTTTLTNVGTAITYADSATLGASFTINETGLYSISYSDTDAGSAIYFGASLNSAQLTTSLQTITAANRLVGAICSSGATPNCSRVVRLTVGDVVRPHATPGVSYTEGAANNQFSIRKVNTP